MSAGKNYIPRLDDSEPPKIDPEKTIYSDYLDCIRIPRISLRAFLAACITLPPAALYVYNIPVRETKTNQEIGELVKERGGFFGIEEREGRGPIYDLHPPVPEVASIFMNSVWDGRHRHLELKEGDLEKMAQAGNLKELRLEYTKVPKGDFVFLRKMHSMEWLVMNSTDLTNEELQYIRNLHSLTILEIGENKGITDEGLSHLQNLDRLKTLYLSGTSVTDEGISALQHLSTLKDLWLERTRVTQAGVSKLKQHLPACVIHSSEEMRP